METIDTILRIGVWTAYTVLQVVDVVVKHWPWVIAGGLLLCGGMALAIHSL